MYGYITWYVLSRASDAGVNTHGCNKAGTSGADSHGQDGHLAVLGSWRGGETKKLEDVT